MLFDFRVAFVHPALKQLCLLYSMAVMYMTNFVAVELCILLSFDREDGGSIETGQSGKVLESAPGDLSLTRNITSTLVRFAFLCNL